MWEDRSCDICLRIELTFHMKRRELKSQKNKWLSCLSLVGSCQIKYWTEGLSFAATYMQTISLARMQEYWMKCHVAIQQFVFDFSIMNHSRHTTKKELKSHCLICKNVCLSHFKYLLICSGCFLVVCVIVFY